MCKCVNFNLQKMYATQHKKNLKITLHGIACETGRSRQIREEHVCLDTVGKGHKNEELFSVLGLET